ncbi:MAG: hypothetical protein EBV65_09765 [Gammaproteobacteria bacterium]|nr:hypothetical protein [Gammaproteobacteria bacterium]
MYALVALGLVLTYKATEVLNFAHGDVLMASAFVGWALIAGAGWPFWLAIPMVLAFAAALGWAIDRQLLRRIAGQPQFAGVMLTIAIAFMIRGAVSMVFGPDSRRFEVPFQGRTQIGPLVINSTMQGVRTRYSWNLLMGRVNRPEEPRFGGLARYDLETGRCQVYHEGPSKWWSEAPFAPADAMKAEDDGYLVGFMTDFVFADEQKIGLSLSLTSLLANPLAAWFLWRAFKQTRERPSSANS